MLGFRLSAATMRMTRSTVLEVLREDYVRTAWAKGLAGKIVVYKHALKNALIPVVTIVGGQLGTLLAGTVIVETIFALPGMGRLTVEAILYPRLSGGADQRHAGGGDARHAEPARRHHLRVARPAHPVPVRPLDGDRGGGPRDTFEAPEVPQPIGRVPGPVDCTMKRKPLGRGVGGHASWCSCSRRSSPTCSRPTIRWRRSPEIRLAAPSRAHPFGTDDIGRDVLSRIIYGSRISLWVGLLAVGIGTFVGMIIGLLCGLLRGPPRPRACSG